MLQSFLGVAIKPQACFNKGQQPDSARLAILLLSGNRRQGDSPERPSHRDLATEQQIFIFI